MRKDINPTFRIYNNKSFIIIPIFILAYFTGVGLCNSLGEFSVGKLAREMLPVVFMGILVLPFCLFELPNIKDTIFSGQRPSLRTSLLVFGSALILGIFLPWSSFSYFGITTFLLISSVVLLFITSLYFLLTNRAYLSVIGFLFFFPVVSYLECWFNNFFPLHFNIAFLTITPTIVFILGIFFASLVTKQMALKSGINKYILIFLAICIIASALSKDPVFSLRELSLELIFPLMFYFVVIKSFKTKRQIKLLIFSLIISVVSISFISLYLFVRYQSYLFSSVADIYGKVFQTGISTSLWASMVMMVLPLALLLPAKSMKERISFYLISILFIGLIFISYSRAAQLSTVIILFILLLCTAHSRRFIIFLLVILTFLFLFKSDFFKYYIFERYKNIFLSPFDATRDTSFSHRLDAWYAAVQIIKGHPLLGIGSGLWKDYVYLYAPMQRIIVEYRRVTEGYIATPHNYYLKVAVDSGIFGFIAYLVLLIAVLRVGLKFIRFSRNKSLRGIMIALLLSITSWSLFSLFLDNFYQGIFLGPGIIFWTIVAGVAILPHLKESESAE